MLGWNQSAQNEVITNGFSGINVDELSQSYLSIWISIWIKIKVYQLHVSYNIRYLNFYIEPKTRLLFVQPNATSALQYSDSLILSDGICARNHKHL